MEGIIDKENERVRRFFAMLDDMEKKVERLARDNRPPFNGERFLTDRELSGTLRISRRCLLLCRLCGIADGGRLSSITVVVVMVISSMRPELNPFVNAALRFIEAGCGTGMALAVALASRAIAGHMRRPPPAAP